MHEELALGESTEFLGFVSNEQLAEEYAKCDVWVNPAIVDAWGDAEGLGVGSIEAYAYRKPVVATNTGGIPDTIRDGETGYLVEEKNPEALAKAIFRPSARSVQSEDVWLGRIAVRSRCILLGQHYGEP